MPNDKLDNDPNRQMPNSNEHNKKRKRWPWILVVFCALILLYVGAVLWTAGPGKTRALQPVNQAVADVNPGQYGTILSDKTIGPNSDQAPERNVIIQVNGTPTATLTKVAQALSGTGFRLQNRHAESERR